MGRRKRGGERSIPLRAQPSGDEMRNQARAIELFHFAFMQVAATQVRPDDFAVKGGANLRFFLRSGRRSADIDLDYLGRTFDAFRDRMNAVLTGATIPTLLKLHEIRIFDVHLRKDTSTTKRWLCKLARPGMSDATSKVEFSNRGGSGDPVLEQADRGLALRLGGVAVKLKHYPPAVAIFQKVDAVCDRTATEPRDVFDLDYLFRQYPDALAHARLDPARVLLAAKIAEDIAYEQYQELVGPFLDEDIVALYSGEDAWFEMQLRVVTQLRQLAQAS
jgi:hypothetical protein